MKPLKVLIVEDNPTDAELMTIELERYGFEVATRRLASAKEMREALLSDRWDAILSDNAMPGFDAREALNVLKGTRLDIPFIIVSGQIGEDIAVACMKAGAHDYIMKDNLAWLGPAVERELKEAEVRRQRRHAEEERERLLERERAARERAEKLYEEASRANRLKDEFLATISHELRTPMNAILGWADLIANGQVAAEEMPQVLETIQRNARLQAKLIDEVLDASRIMSGKMELKTGPVRLNEIVAETVKTLSLAAEGKDITVEVRSDGTILPVHGDRDRLLQVVWNLLSNAIKFTLPGGHVDVILKGDSSWVELTIADDGVGIDPDFLPYVFERFRQEAASTTREHGGLGLGLSIVREIVAMHGGEIRASSPGKGKGATFVMRLPVRNLGLIGKPGSAKTPPGRPPPSSDPDRDTLSGIKILLVDDSPDILKLLQVMLERFGASVATAASGREALQLAKERQFDAILCDIGMPEMDGYTFIEALRHLERQTGRHVPAAALTAYAAAQERQRALAAGFETHIAKPVSTKVLIPLVAKLAKREFPRAEEC